MLHDPLVCLGDVYRSFITLPILFGVIIIYLGDNNLIHISFSR